MRGVWWRRGRLCRTARTCYPLGPFPSHDVPHISTCSPHARPLTKRFSSSPPHRQVGTCMASGLVLTTPQHRSQPLASPQSPQVHCWIALCPAPGQCRGCQGMRQQAGVGGPLIHAEVQAEAELGWPGGDTEHRCGRTPTCEHASMSNRCPRQAPPFFFCDSTGSGAAGVRHTGSTAAQQPAVRHIAVGRQGREGQARCLEAPCGVGGEGLQNGKGATRQAAPATNPKGGHSCTVMVCAPRSFLPGADIWTCHTGGAISSRMEREPALEQLTPCGSLPPSLSQLHAARPRSLAPTVTMALAPPIVRSQTTSDMTSPSGSGY